MRINGISADSRDTVVTVTEDVRQGETVRYRSGSRELTVKALEPIPVYHKIAAAPAAKGDAILKYGERIGVALVDIEAGEHVHEHNLGPRLED